MPGGEYCPEHRRQIFQRRVVGVAKSGRVRRATEHSDHTGIRQHGQLMQAVSATRPIAALSSVSGVTVFKGTAVMIAATGMVGHAF
jgi:hypothetical protein